MEYYYMEGGERVGPLTAEEFNGALQAGKIRPDTHVWRTGMQDWVLHADFAALAASASAPGQAQAGESPENRHACSECGGVFDGSAMMRYREHWICAGCKPVFLQRVREGGALPGTMNYAPFLTRFAAKFVDNLLVGAVNLGVGFAVGMLIPVQEAGDGPSPAVVALAIVSNLLSFVLYFGYTTFFIGRFGATPGKMACGIRVVMADGGRVTYLRAFCRGLAEMVSGLTCSIGYLIAAFDKEHRSLHDHMCNTRVVRK